MIKGEGGGTLKNVNIQHGPKNRQMCTKDTRKDCDIRERVVYPYLCSFSHLLESLEYIDIHTILQCWYTKS